MRTATGKKKRAKKILATTEQLKHIPRESKDYARKILGTRIESSKALIPKGGELERTFAALTLEITQLLWFTDGVRKNYTPQPLTAFMEI